MYVVEICLLWFSHMRLSEINEYNILIKIKWFNYILAVNLILSFFSKLLHLTCDNLLCVLIYREEKKNIMVSIYTYLWLFWFLMILEEKWWLAIVSKKRKKTLFIHLLCIWQLCHLKLNVYNRRKRDEE